MSNSSEIKKASEDRPQARSLRGPRVSGSWDLAGWTSKPPLAACRAAPSPLLHRGQQKLRVTGFGAQPLEKARLAPKPPARSSVAAGQRRRQRLGSYKVAQNST
jgi:hypothetical protein